MNNSQGIFSGDDPFAITRRWLAEASETELNDPNAVALATVDADGLPNVRMVLCKAIEDDALVFFTNYESQKAQELASGKAALVFHWKSKRRQIRVRGLIERESAEASDGYYSSRSLGSRIGAWASAQSRPLSSRGALAKAVAAAGIKHGTNPSRPPFWGGYRLKPVEFEFWADGEFRLHDRFRWTRDTIVSDWKIQRLHP